MYRDKIENIYNTLQCMHIQENIEFLRILKGVTEFMDTFVSFDDCQRWQVEQLLHYVQCFNNNVGAIKNEELVSYIRIFEKQVKQLAKERFNV